MVTVLLLTMLAALAAACGRANPEISWPAAAPSQAAEAQPAQSAVEEQYSPVIEEVPDFSAWVIGEQVTEEQQIYLNRLVEYAWYSYFSPYARPDCAALRSVLASENPWQGTVEQHCEQMSRQGYFVMFPILTEWGVSYHAFPESPNQIRFVVRLDSGAPWVADVRYYQDGAQMGYMEYLHTIIDFHIAIEDGRLLIGMIDEFYLDREGGLWDRGDNGDLVRVD
jgi:hypothetical protein